MTTLQMRAKKTEIIGTIINEVDSEDKLETISLLLKKIIIGEKHTPCQYSVTELNERAAQAISDYEEGKNLFPHNQIKRKRIAK